MGSRSRLSWGRGTGPTAAVFLIVVVLLPVVQGAESGAAGAAPLVWGECRDDQIRVMIFGTFHFDQTKAIDILENQSKE